MNKFEKISVSSPEISCDGGTGAMGHPKVYLRIEQEKDSIACPYCSRTYILKPEAKTAKAGH
jgi:uncharacterized Zn-finger protein